MEAPLLPPDNKGAGSTVEYVFYRNRMSPFQGYLLPGNPTRGLHPLLTNVIPSGFRNNSVWGIHCHHSVGRELRGCCLAMRRMWTSALPVRRKKHPVSEIHCHPSFIVLSALKRGVKSYILKSFLS